MTKILKILSVLVVLGGLGYGGVYAYQNFIAGGGLNPEIAMPADISMVFAFDHSNSEQVKNLDKLLEDFPKDDPGIEYLKSMYDQKVDAEFYYAELEKLLDCDWKVAVGVKMNMDEMVTDFAPTAPETLVEEDDSLEPPVLPDEEASDTPPVINTGEPQSSVAYAAMIVPGDEPASVVDAMKEQGEYTPPMDIYIAGTFDSADEIEALLKLKTAENADYIYSEKDGVKYWDNEVEDVYILRYKDMFVLTNSLKNKDKILDGIKNKNGLVADENFKKMKKTAGEDVLAYAYINVPDFAATNPDLSTDLGAVYAALMANGEGFKTKSFTDLKSKDSFVVKGLLDAPKPSILEKVNAENIIAYTEIPKLKLVLESMAQGFQSSMGFNGLNPITGTTKNLSSQDFSEIIAETLKVDKDDIDVITESPVAFSISADSLYYPSISVYLKIDEKTQEVAQKVFDAMDSYMDEMVASLKEQTQGPASEVSGDEKQNFISSTAEASCYVMEAENINDPGIEGHVKAVYDKYGFDSSNNAEMKALSAKYASDQSVAEAIKAEMEAMCGDKIPDSPSLQSVADSVTTDLVAEGEPEFFLKKETIDTNGMDLVHWYVDWALFPENEVDDANEFFKTQLMIPEGIEALELGLYYGFPEEGIMILSLQPDLPAVYGKTPLSGDPLFKEGMSKLEGDGWGTISYLRPENLFLITKNYVRLFSINPGMTEMFTKVYNSFESVSSTFQYLIDGQKVQGEEMISEGYAKIQKFEKSTTVEEKPETKEEDDAEVAPPATEDEVIEDDAKIYNIDNPEQPDTDLETPPKVKRVK